MSLAVGESETPAPPTPDAFLTDLAEWMWAGKPHGWRYSQYTNRPPTTTEASVVCRDASPRHTLTHSARH